MGLVSHLSRFLCRDEEERQWMLDMHERLLPITQIAGAISILMAFAIVPWTNPLALLPILAGSVGMAVAAAVTRARGDLLAILVAATGLQLAIAAAVLINDRAGVGDLFLLITGIVPASAGFPGRVVTAQAVFAGLLMVVVAVVTGAALASPPILVLPLMTLVSVTIMATAIRRASMDHRRAALIDGLTGAHNRAALGQRSAELDDAGEGMAVVIADVDNFKQVNDLYGHQAGDRVLVELAALLGRHGDAFRMGGDEFVLLFSGADAADAQTVADAIVEAVRRAPLGGVDVSVSVGVAATGSGVGHGFTQAFAAADTALYRAKRAGRDAVRLAGGGLAVA